MTVTTRYPTTDTAVSGTWTTPTSVQANDGAVARVNIAAKNVTRDREQGGYGFDTAIPSGATVNSVQLEVEHNVSTSGGIAFLENLGYISATAGAVNSDNTEPISLTARAYPNYARPGGGSWTRADLLDGTFKTRIRARSGNNATSVDYDWDYIRVTVDYSAGTTFFQTLAATAAGVASLSTSTTFAKTLAATTVGVAALATALLTSVAMAAAAVGVATLSRVATYSRTLAAAAVGVATLTKGLFVTLSATAIGVPALAKGMFKTLAAIASGVPTLATALLSTVGMAATAVCSRR